MAVGGGSLPCAHTNTHNPPSDRVLLDGAHSKLDVICRLASLWKPLPTVLQSHITALLGGDATNPSPDFLGGCYTAPELLTAARTVLVAAGVGGTGTPAADFSGAGVDLSSLSAAAVDSADARKALRDAVEVGRLRQATAGDVYALGVLMLECMLGRVPALGSRTADVAEALAGFPEMGEVLCQCVSTKQGERPGIGGCGGSATCVAPVARSSAARRAS